MTKLSLITNRMKSILLRVIILVSILSVPSYFLYKDYRASVYNEPKKEKIDKSTTTPIVKTEVKIDKIQVVPVTVEMTTINKGSFVGTKPNLDRKWSIPESYSSDAKRILITRINGLVVDLKSSASQYDKWIELGSFAKIIGDYQEASNIWEYTAVNWPDAIVAYHNLGDLYGSYLKDYVKAEKNMLRVIDLDKSYTSEYISLYGLYTRLYGVKDERVPAILIKGLMNNPKSVDLMITLATYYRDISDGLNARKYYEMAMVQAKELSNLKLQDTIEEELKKL